ncbi:MAG: ribokinase [Rhodobacteraceae bacterium]|nr:ribokinase [Paracoccaceae bacterium]
MATADGRPRIVVLGGAHIDLIAAATRAPAIGESILGDSFSIAPGGKAACQAAQMARCGAQVKLVSRLGGDHFGRLLRDALSETGVDLLLTGTDQSLATGASAIFATGGDYASITIPGAANKLSARDVERARDAIEAADALVLQLEISADTSATAAAMAAAEGRPVILNASPSPEAWSTLPEQLQASVDTLIVNKSEAERLAGGGGIDVEFVKNSGVRTAVVTLGSKGALVFEDGAMHVVPAFPTAVVDVTGAGDAFLGAFVAARLFGARTPDAIVRGAAAGAITVSRRGAFEALPEGEEIEAFLDAANAAPRPTG